MKQRMVKGRGIAMRSERSGAVSRGALVLLLLIGLISTASAVTVDTFGGSWGGTHMPGPNTGFQFDIANPVNAPTAVLGTSKFTDPLTVSLVDGITQLYSAVVGVVPPGSPANNIKLGNLRIIDSLTTLVVAEFSFQNPRLFQITGAPVAFGLIQADMTYISHGNAVIDAELTDFAMNGGRFGLTFNGGLVANSNGTVSLPSDTVNITTASYTAIAKLGNGVPEPANLTMLLSGTWLLITSGWMMRRDRRAVEQGLSEAPPVDKQL